MPKLQELLETQNLPMAKRLPKVATRDRREAILTGLDIGDQGQQPLVQSVIDPNGPPLLSSPESSQELSSIEPAAGPAAGDEPGAPGTNDSADLNDPESSSETSTARTSSAASPGDGVGGDPESTADTAQPSAPAQFASWRIEEKGEFFIDDRLRQSLEAGLADDANPESAPLNAGDGVEAYRAGDYEKAAAIWFDLAKTGNPRSQFHFAGMLAEGRLDEPDPVAAYMWLRKSEAGGYGPAVGLKNQVETQIDPALLEQLKNVDP